MTAESIDTPSDQRPFDSRAVYQFRGVARVYPGPPAVEALQPFDLDIDRGRLVTIVGPSGSGKSTLLNLAGLLDSPTHGELMFDGQDAAAMSEQDRCFIRGGRIGFVFQAYHLLNVRTVAQNVALAGLYQGTPVRQRLVLALDALQRVGMSHRVDSLARNLSGGERQRVAIARAISHGPAVLLCDEPTGNLDSVNAKAVLAILTGLAASGITVIIVTHDAEVAALGEQRVQILDGRVHERV